MHKEIDYIDHQYPKLNHDIEVDVLIIGGGLSGAISAYLFHEKKINIAVIERNRIVNKSINASTSIHQYEIDRDLKKLETYFDEIETFDAFLFTLESLYKLDDITEKLENNCDYIRRPSFFYTNIEEKNSKYCNEDKLNADNIRKEYIKNGFKLPLCSEILSYKSGVEVNPIKLTNEIFKYCTKHNIPIYGETAAYEFIIEDEGVIVVTKDSKRIKSKKVLITSNDDSSIFFDKPYTTLTRSLELMDGFYDLNDCPYTNLSTEDKVGFEITPNDINRIDNHYLAQYKYQIIEKREIEYHINGLYTNTNNEFPFIDNHKDYPNIYFNIGIGSDSLLYSLMGAILLSEKYLGIDNERLEFFKFSR